MSKLSESQRESLNRAVSKYHASLEGSEAEEFLARRGFNLSEVDKYRFGFVAEPETGHEKYRGKLAIPYLRVHPRFGWMTVSIRFRALGDEKPKYLTMPGDRPRVYNTPVLTNAGPDIGIAEGELDAVTASVCGMPTVGVPGASSWQEHWTPLFEGYRTVFVFADGDEPGEELAAGIAGRLKNAKIIHSKPGEDINSLFVKEGRDAVQKLWS